MSARLAMTIATFIVVFAAAGLSWLVGLRSEKWSQRIAFFGVIALFQGSIAVLMTPADA